MSKILLIHPPFGTGNDKRPQDIFDPNFPWGLGYIAGALKEDGYDIEIFDVYVHQWNRAETLEKLKNKEFDCVLITAMATQYSYIKWLALMLKEINKECIIIIGGQLATFSYEVVLNNTLVDICVIGEGEITIRELMKNLNNFKNIKGIALKES
jgi:anaerobic magnesium-protoporphyrin IX monomethyl ester cyclase